METVLRPQGIEMDRFDCPMPDFTRLSWVSDAASAVWAPRLQRINQAWAKIEWLSVAQGVRSCGITTVSPEDFLASAGDWASHGLNPFPVEIQGTTPYSYSAVGVKAELGKPFVFRIVLGTPSSVMKFKSAWDASDNREIGRLLGYPPCCLEFFQRVWVDHGMVDTTWPMGVATAAPVQGTHVVEVSGPPQANILWRWMGARAVFHLPCRFDCQATVEMGDRFLQVGREAGFDAEMDWLLEILQWPVEWSALHGIAEIKTPVLKVSTRADATLSKYTVRREGTDYPAEGARGLTFPYRLERPPRLTQSRSFRRGLENRIELQEARPAWYALDNGFPSILAMDSAHKPIVDLAVETLKGKGETVLDLGCGNGALLQKISASSPHVVPFGVEMEADRVEHARILNPEFSDQFVQGDLLESDLLWPEDRRYTLALLMPGRLLEGEPQQALKLKARLKSRCDRILVYAYGDWLTRHGGLPGLAHKAGLVFLGPDSEAKVGFVKIK